jgi:hypothetical protein
MGMRSSEKFLMSIALLVAAIPASADSVYVVTSNQQFGTFDINTGAFNPIGPGTPEAASGLVPGPNGTLLTLTVSGNLDAINPGTGQVVSSLPTGLGNCTAPVPGQCGPTSANTLAELGGVLYATDYQNNLFKINPMTGAKTFLASTGVPPVSPLVPYSQNADGSFNIFGEALVGANGNLYATFFTGTVDPTTFVPTPVMPDHLYQINPATGATANLGPSIPTTFSLDTIVNVNSTYYAFANAFGEIDTIDLANGATTTAGGFDPGSVGLILGATPTPELMSIALVAVGMAILLCRRRGANLRRIARR